MKPLRSFSSEYCVGESLKLMLVASADVIILVWYIWKLLILELAGSFNSMSAINGRKLIVGC